MEKKKKSMTMVRSKDTIELENWPIVAFFTVTHYRIYAQKLFQFVGLDMSDYRHPYEGMAVLKTAPP